MHRFFYPHNVAVVGVSEDPENLGRNIVNNFIEFGFQGKIYPVGPRGGSIHGLTILPSLLDLPEPVDLVAILAPAPVVPGLLDDCGRLGVTRVVVESGGFSEHSEGGLLLEQEVKARLQRYGIRMIGPNGLGVMNLENGVVLPFILIPLRPALGGISLVCQSGGVGSNLMSWLAQTGLGLNKFISMGNKLDVNENDLLAFLLEDPGTRIIYLYLEDIADGSRLMEVARGAGKPIILHKANIGETSAAIARSHTASLLVDDRVVDAACAQTGILRVRTRQEFLLAAMALMQPPFTGNNLAILSRSGGEAVVAADACHRCGFALPPITPEVQELIRRRSRAGVIQPQNPLDLGDIFDFSLYNDVVAAFCRDERLDGIVYLYGPVSAQEKDEARASARIIVETAARHQKPLATVVVGNLEEQDYLRRELGVPVFTFPGEAIRALAVARDWHRRAQRPPAPVPGPPATLGAVRRIISPFAGTSGPLLLPDALEAVQSLGITVPGWMVATSPEAAERAAVQLGFPAVLKLVAPGALHKSDLGGIRLDLTTPEAVRQGFVELAQVAAYRLPPEEAWQVLVMKQVDGGLEVILGAHRDPKFGPVILFGAGGIWVEVLQDVALGVAPLTAEAARGLIAQTRVSAILKGGRGQPPLDIPALTRDLMLLGDLMLEFPEIREVDLNPVRVYPEGMGTLVLDARIILGEPPGHPASAVAG